MEISKELQEAINDQINFELYSGYIYLSMAAYFESINLSGMAKWMKVQASEEYEHAMRFWTHIVDRGGRVILTEIKGPATEWTSPHAAFENAYEHEKIVTPDCVQDWGGRSYDMNTFYDNGDVKNHRYYKFVKNGIFSPPADYEHRRHLHTLRCLDRVPLSSVGGTMLLVHASVYKAGITFPEKPYDHLLETEGFGRICRDFGVTPIGLPNVQIKHVNS